MVWSATGRPRLKKKASTDLIIARLLQAAGDIAREANEGQSGLAHLRLHATALRKAKPMSEPLVQRVADATPKRIARRIRGLSDRAIAWIFVGPTIFLLLAVNIFPLIWTIRLTFSCRVGCPRVR